MSSAVSNIKKGEFVGHSTCNTFQREEQDVHKLIVFITWTLKIGHQESYLQLPSVEAYLNPNMDKCHLFCMYGYTLAWF